MFVIKVENLVKKFGEVVAVNGIRGAIIGKAYFGFGIDFIVLGGLTILLFGLGSYFFSRIQI